MTKNKRKKILFLLHLPPPVHGSSMVGQWIRESILINSRFVTSYINLLASKKVSESGKVTVGKLLGMFVICFQLIIQLLKKRPHICYLALTTTGAAFYRDALLVAILKVFGVKRSFHLHNKGVAMAAKSTLNDFLYRFVFKKAKVILLSPHLYTDIQKYVLEKEVFYCPNGIPELAIKELKRPHKNDVVNVLFLSNLIESKGVFVLLEALSILESKHFNFTCSFIGGEADITAESFNAKTKELGLSTKVTYLGRKYGDEKNEYFSNADIFVLPTHYSNECFPLVLLEAMQFSLPIVSTFEGGIPDVVQDAVTGFLLKQQDIEGLTEKVATLIKDADLRMAMGKEGRKRFEKHFTLATFENRLYQILKEV